MSYNVSFGVRTHSPAPVIGAVAGIAAGLALAVACLALGIIGIGIVAAAFATAGIAFAAVVITGVTLAFLFCRR